MGNNSSRGQQQGQQQGGSQVGGAGGRPAGSTTDPSQEEFFMQGQTGAAGYGGGTRFPMGANGLFPQPRADGSSMLFFPENMMQVCLAYPPKVPPCDALFPG